MKKRPLIPILPCFLFVMWLLLNESLSAGHIVLGAIFAWLVTLAVARLRPLPAWPRRLYVGLSLAFLVFADVIRSNLGVGSVILNTHRRQPHIGFLDIQLDIRDPHGVAMLALILTATPGTVWAGHDLTSNRLTLHILDLQDEATWIQLIKYRYECRLMEIFE